MVFLYCGGGERGAAEVDFDAESVGEGGFGPEAFIGGLSVWGVGDLDVVGLGAWP